MQISNKLEKSVEEIAKAINKNWWKDGKYIISILLSIATLVISVGISINIQSPFSLRVVNSVFIIPNSFVDNVHYYPEGLNLALYLTFLNNARNSGLIEDVYVNVNFNDKEYFNNIYPSAAMDPDLVFSKCGVGTGKKIAPFILGSEQALNKVYIFPLGNIQKGIYTVDLYVKANGKWLDVSRQNFLITETIQANYLKGDVVYDLDTKKYSVQECNRVIK